MLRTALIGLALSLLTTAASAQQVVRLWPGKAPGTETWTVKETVTTLPNGDQRIANVSDPTLTAYLPEKAKATGTAVIIAPGGGLRALGVETELIRQLNGRGIAAFVLKYRTLQMEARAPSGFSQPRPGGGVDQRPEMTIVNGNANPAPDDPKLTEVLHMAVADAQEAVKLVRRNAGKWNVDPNKVGFMGFSAGGGVAVGAALAPPGEAYPDFLISAYGPSLQDVEVPAHAAPLFMVVGQNHYNVTSGLLALFSEWKAAGKPAELHVYDMINGPIGMTRTGMPVDGWFDLAMNWLTARGFAAQQPR